MSTLYRKYRPQKFSDLYGQDSITTTITNEIATDKVAHAYLFSGPRGVGKTTMARLLAKAVNCTGRTAGSAEPCDECSSCLEIARGNNIDVNEIDAASHTGVENVRENIIENAQFKPTKSKYKVFIIDEVHMLSTAAFNALLKTLEEPPTHIIFILATTEEYNLLPTIVSRCQRFNFKKLPRELMMKRLNELCKLEKIKVDKEVLEKIIVKSEGCGRDAESLLGQIMSLGKKEISLADAQIILPISTMENTLEFMDLLAQKDAPTLITRIGTYNEEGVNFDHFFLDLLRILRAGIYISTTGDGGEYTAELGESGIKKLRQAVAAISTTDLVLLADMMLRRRTEVKFSPLPSLPLELLVIEWSSRCPEQRISPVSSSPNAVVAPTVTAKIPDIRPIETMKPTIKPAETKAETPSHNTFSSGPINSSFVDIKSHWSEMIIKVSETNASLSFILKTCRLSKLEDNLLTIAVPYSLHKEKLDKNKKVLEDVTAEIMKERIRINIDVCEEPKNVPDPALQSLAADFGGQVMA